PISTIIFVSEMTNSYHLLLPSLMVCSLAFLLSRKWTIYVKQVRTKIDSNAHRGDFFVDVLGTIRVKELMPQVRKVELVPEDMPFSAFRKMFSSTDQHYFPVVNKENRLTGIFSINDIRGILFDQAIGDLVVMEDIANPDIIVTTPSEDLNEVLKKFTIRNLHRLPVVKEEDHTILIGMLDRREVIQYYNQKVQEIKSTYHRVEIESDREVSQLKNVPVGRAMRREIETIRSDMPLKQLREFVYHSKFNTFPVVDAPGQLIGILSLSDCQKTFDENAEKTLTAEDIATRDVVTVTDDDTMFLALTRIIQGDFSVLPVVNKQNPKHLTGVISRRDIMSAYDDIVIRKVLIDESAA
ncbi:MAG: CBS domain-containing protein, partial [Desulfobacterales bacterium]|nr:CBS domain-containing protein [Desulfobacterales bacterium]